MWGPNSGRFHAVTGGEKGGRETNVQDVTLFLELVMHPSVGSTAPFSLLGTGPMGREEPLCLGAQGRKACDWEKITTGL